jgi:Flp pilus assembly protein TadD
LCNADFRLRDFDEATAHCRKAVSYDRAHAYSHYLLGLIYAERSNQVASDLEAAELMAAALQRFEAMLEINLYMEPEADNARQTIAHITEYLSSR